MLLMSHDDAILAKESHGDQNQTRSKKKGTAPHTPAGGLASPYTLSDSRYGKIFWQGTVTFPDR